MSAEVFLAAFLGCLFALGAVTIALYTYYARKLRRGIVEMLRGFHQYAPPEIRSELDQWAAERAAERSGSGVGEIVLATLVSRFMESLSQQQGEVLTSTLSVDQRQALTEILSALTEKR